MCTTSINSNRWLILSSEGCPQDWGTSSRAASECAPTTGTYIPGTYRLIGTSMGRSNYGVHYVTYTVTEDGKVEVIDVMHVNTHGWGGTAELSENDTGEYEDYPYKITGGSYKWELARFSTDPNNPSEAILDIRHYNPSFCCTGSGSSYVGGCALYIAGPVVASSGNQVATVDSLQNYELSFTMELASDFSVTGNWQSILHIGDTDGQRFPGVWLHHSENQIYVFQSHSYAPTVDESVAGYTKVGDNYCVDDAQTNLGETQWDDGQASRSACGQECDDEGQCSGFEWYDAGWTDSSHPYFGSRCFLILDKDGQGAATDFKRPGRWLDAQCYIKDSDPTVMHCDAYGCDWYVNSPSIFAAGETYEIKVIVENNQMTMYVDGVSVGTLSGSATYVATEAAVYVGDPWWDTAKVTLSDITLCEIHNAGGGDDDDDSDDNSLVVILGVVIGALIVVIAILAMMKRRRPEKPPHGRRGPATAEAATSPTAPQQPALASIKAEALGMMAEEPIAEAIMPHGHVSGAEAAAMAAGEPPSQPSAGWGRRFASWRAVAEPPPPPEAEFEPEI